MKNRMHHLTAFLLCVVLSFTMIFSADAAVLDNTPQNDSLTWKVEDGTLFISGTGPMADYKPALSEKDSQGRGYLRLLETLSERASEQGDNTLHS